MIARVYYGPIIQTEKEKIGLKRYVDKHPGIELIGYENIPGSENETFGYFGHYIKPNTATAMGTIQPYWRFIFKAYSTGTIVGELRLSTNLRRFVLKLIAKSSTELWHLKIILIPWFLTRAVTIY